METEDIFKLRLRLSGNDSVPLKLCTIDGWTYPVSANAKTVDFMLMKKDIRSYPLYIKIFTVNPDVEVHSILVTNAPSN
jgi:hypothetical protein